MKNEIVRESGWERWHDWMARVMEPVTTWICDSIDASPGMTVLDAACGTGVPALAIAERVGPNGKLVATDVSPVMIAAVSRGAARAGLTNIETREVSLAALAFPDASFDAVTCKDGLMYCPDMAQGAHELHRVLRPGGRFAVTAWDAIERTAFFRTMFQTLAPYLDAPPDPRGPGPLRLSGPGVLEGVLREGGFSDVTIERREVVFAFDSIAMHWDVIADTAAPIAAATAKLDAAGLARLKQAFADALAPYTTEGRVRLPTTALCATGTRS